MVVIQRSSSKSQRDGANSQATEWRWPWRRWHWVELFVNNQTICQRNAVQQISSATGLCDQMLEGKREKKTNCWWLRTYAQTSVGLLLTNEEPILPLKCWNKFFFPLCECHVNILLNQSEMNKFAFRLTQPFFFFFKSWYLAASDN